MIFHFCLLQLLLKCIKTSRVENKIEILTTNYNYYSIVKSNFRRILYFELQLYLKTSRKKVEDYRFLNFVLIFAKK